LSPLDVEQARIAMENNPPIPSSGEFNYKDYMYKSLIPLIITRAILLKGKEKNKLVIMSVRVILFTYLKNYIELLPVVSLSLLNFTVITELLSNFNPYSVAIDVKPVLKDLRVLKEEGVK